LFDLLNPPGLGQLRRTVDLLHLAISSRHAIEHAWCRRHQIHVVLALETFLDDFHVQQPEEPAAESEAERGGGLRLVEERRVVETQLLERFAKFGVLMALDWIQ